MPYLIYLNETKKTSYMHQSRHRERNTNFETRGPNGSIRPDAVLSQYAVVVLKRRYDAVNS